MGILILTDAEQRRADVLTRLCSGSITGVRAAQLLGLTERQVRRLRIGFKRDALQSIPHGNKGRLPSRTLAEEVKDQIWVLAGPQGLYHDFNTCHLSETLAQSHGILIGRSTLQRLLYEKRNPKLPKEKKPPPMRTRRLRSSSEGEMVQIDGSPHDWLQGRAAKMCLMGAVDDAGGEVLYLQFGPTENTAGYLRMFRSIAVDYGLPMSFYHDKHTILRSPKKPTIQDELAGLEPMSHVQKVMHDLGVQSIAAHSPQAKGRVERLWRTLQDRLIKEMRVAGVGAMHEANLFLPGFIARYNAQFPIPPMSSEPMWVQMLPDADLDFLFSIQDTRTVKQDHTISFEGQILQICPGSRRRSLSGHAISVRTNHEGQVFLYDAKTRLQYKSVPEPTKRQVNNSNQSTEMTVKKTTVQLDETHATYKPNAKQRAFLFAKN